MAASLAEAGREDRVAECAVTGLCVALAMFAAESRLDVIELLVSAQAALAGRTRVAGMATHTASPAIN